MLGEGLGGEESCQREEKTRSRSSFRQSAKDLRQGIKILSKWITTEQKRSSSLFPDRAPGYLPPQGVGGTAPSLCQDRPESGAHSHIGGICSAKQDPQTHLKMEDRSDALIG